MKYERL